jgi:hypothetical protein
METAPAPDQTAVRVRFLLLLGLVVLTLLAIAPQALAPLWCLVLYVVVWGAGVGCLVGSPPPNRKVLVGACLAAAAISALALLAMTAGIWSRLAVSLIAAAGVLALAQRFLDSQRTRT